MSGKRMLLIGVVLLCVLAVAPTGLYAQATTSGVVRGTVEDPSKAVVPGAQVTLTNLATNIGQTTETNAQGIYVFPAVPVGDYTLRCSAKGFQTAENKNVHVEVLKTVTIDITLQIGVASQVVEVTTGTGAELQTTDASIGTVISGDALLRLPTQQRSITSLMLLQPGVSPNAPGGVGSCSLAANCDVNGGGVAGALPDQTTFYVDGGDATSDLEGTNNYVSPPGEPQPAPFIAVPAETVQEFRVVTSSPTAGFTRSQGGQVGITTKSGTNSFHGSGYEYYYGNALNGNDWGLNLPSVDDHPHSVNNRFGTSVGGPILKDKLFFFGNYEGRRFHQNTTIDTAVPSDMVRTGVLRFVNSSGATISYNFNPANGPLSTQCGPTGTTACDNRTIFPAGFTGGASPLVLNYLKLFPEPNNPSFGDSLNAEGFIGAYAEPVREDLAVGKIDYTINPKWSLFGTFHYNRYRLATGQQFDILTRSLTSSTPVEPRLTTFQLTGQVTPHFTTQTHGSYLRDWWGWNRAALAPQVPGTAGTINISGESRIADSTATKVWADPTNFDTQNARSRIWAGKDWFAAEDATWLHGTHTIQFGGGYYFWNLIHQRTDIVTGGLTGGPIYYVGETSNNGNGSFLGVSSAETPPTCGVGAPANCLTTGDAGRWAAMYASLLGLVDRSTQVGTRNGDFIANPLGTPLIDHVHTHTMDLYIQDSWKIRPSVTLSYGLSYGVQFAPHELNGKQVVQVFSATGQPLSDLQAFFNQRNAALSNGSFFASGATAGTDSTFGFSPIRHIPGRNSSATTSWNNLGPRVAVAWNLPYDNRVFGNRQTVIRGGYSILWSRTSAVGEVLTPLLGNGLASISECAGPTTPTPGVVVGTATCSGAAFDATTGFRLGVDGSTVPIPAFTNASIPLVGGSPFGVSRSSTQDPNITPAYSHNVSIDVQRAFKGNWFLDVGYLGRFARNLWQNLDINAADPFARTPGCVVNGTTCIVGTSGQTLAQAFDSVSRQLRSGVAAASVTPQPFFENAPFGCSGCTALAAGGGTTAAINGDLASFMLFNYDFIAPQPLDPLQAVLNNVTTDGGRANYNAMFITARKATPNWVTAVNYTWSHSTGTYSGSGNYIGQQYTFFSVPTPFDYKSGTASNNGDRRHIFNATWYYVLPFGKGQHYSSSNEILNRVVGGWYVSGIWSWETGLPQCIFADGNYGAITGTTCATGAALFGQDSRHNGVTGGSGIATAGAPANGGTGINLFANPVGVYQSLSRPLLSVNGRPDQEAMNLPRSWNVDFGFGKNLVATERYKMVFSAEFFNLFNHPIFGTTPFSPNVSYDLNAPSSFGVISDQDNLPRTIQLGLRFEF